MREVHHIDANCEYPCKQASEFHWFLALLHEDVHLDFERIALEQQLVADKAHRAAVGNVARREEHQGEGREADAEPDEKGGAAGAGQAELLGWVRWRSGWTWRRWRRILHLKHQIQPAEVGVALQTLCVADADAVLLPFVQPHCKETTGDLEGVAVVAVHIICAITAGHGLGKEDDNVAVLNTRARNVDGRRGGQGNSEWCEND